MENQEFENLIIYFDTFSIEEHSGLAYIEKGKGEQTILFVHGLGSNRYAWLSNIFELSTHYRCIAIDLPNYGDSLKGDFSFDVSFFKSKILAFCAALHLENICLVGHSMGAQIAAHLGIQKPSLFTSLVLLTPAGIETFNDFEKQWFRQINIPEILFNATKEQIRQNFEINFVHFGKEAKFLLDQRLQLMNDKIAFYQYCKMICKCVDGMLDASINELLHLLVQPVLVLFGEKDLLIPNKILHHSLTAEDLKRVAARKIPTSDVRILPDAGHFIQIDQKEQVNAIISKFLD